MTGDEGKGVFGWEERMLVKDRGRKKGVIWKENTVTRNGIDTVG